LVCVVHDNKLFCGNAGDSLGILVEEGSPMGYIEINRFLNADNAEEQQRLKQLYPNEEDIVVCKRPNNSSCYVKGRLQPTRTLGDLRLKMAEFNNPKNYPREF
jgi:pyruvate dehydrogenase phosphatase